MLRYAPLVFKQVVRHRTRTMLTVGGVGVAMFLFCIVQALHAGVERATRLTSEDTMLVVYRENRYCPFASRLPQWYEDRIARLPGVREVVPMRIVVNNCRVGLDVVTFRGLPAEKMPQVARGFSFVEGSLASWESRSDAAILGEALARRRGFRAGQSFDAAGITVYIAAIVRSSEPQEQNVAWVHLDFLQRSSSRIQDGIVTQFNVRVDDPARLAEVARAIDEQFRHDAEPTQTRPEKAFVAQAAADIVQIVGFTQWLGWGALAAVLALVGNAVVLSVQDRIKEHAIMQTLGFRGGAIGALIVAEGVLLGLMGGGLGAAAAMAVLRFWHFNLSVEGVTVAPSTDAGVVMVGLFAAAALGVLAGLVPAWRASRREIAACFRAV
jgi:putative ABC transport system permease protein